MTPADLHLSGRQFFAYAVPGVMWLAAICLAVGQDPIAFLEAGSDSIRVLIRTAGFLGVSYAMVYGAQKLFFLLATKLHEPADPHADLLSAVKDVMKPLAVDEPDLAPMCKWYVLEHSRHLKTVAIEREVGINLLVAVPPALLALSIGTLVFGLVHSSSPGLVRLGVIGFGFGSVLWLILWTSWLRESRNRERHDWCKMFLLLARRSPEHDTKP